MFPSVKCIVACGLLVLGLAASGLAQQTGTPPVFAKRNSVYLSFEPNANQQGYAANYDRLLYQSGRHKWFGGLHFGAMSFINSARPFPTRRAWVLSGAVSANYSLALGPRGHGHLDLGASYTYERMSGVFSQPLSFPMGGIAEEEATWRVFGAHVFAPYVGYRYQRPQGGLTWRGGIEPFRYFTTSTMQSENLWNMALHVGVGWSF
jgi:hypothetical protein